MVVELARNWWTLALRGLAAVLFGIVAWIWPDLTVTALVLLFGAFALVDGVFTVVAALRGRGRDPNWGALLLGGISGIALGLMTLAWPGITALVLMYLVAAWAIVTGAFELIAAIRLRREIEGEWLFGLSGVLSILFGVLVAIFPGEGAVALVWLIGAYAVVFGMLLIALALRLRGWQQRGPTLLPST
jgi:uncharacterized membrane protein HdeD (DUF308 family)